MLSIGNGRRRLNTLAVAGCLVASLGACTGGTTDISGGTGGNGASLTMAADAATTWARNFNIYSPASDKSPALRLLFEPLVRVDYTQGAKADPWLAKSFDWNSKGTALTFHLRTDVAWSDGRKFTADDVVYTLRLMLEHPELNRAGVTYKKVTKVDGSTVKVTWDHAAYSELSSFGTGSLDIVPRHQWAHKDLKTWTNNNPVGTGPYTLADFNSQQVTYKARDDYWGARVAVPAIKIPAVLGDATKPKMLTGELDLATTAWAGADKDFVARDPKTNVYAVYATGGSTALYFNNAVAPYNNVHVRRALSAAVDARKMLSLNDTGQAPANITGLDEQAYGDVIAREYRGKVNRQDIALAKRELKAGGYTVRKGELVKGGKSYPLELKIIQEYANWQAYARGFADQAKQALGLNVKVLPVQSSSFDPEVNEGDYGMAFNYAGSGTGVFNSYSAMLDSSYAQPIGKNSNFDNTERWKDPQTDRLLHRLSETDDPARIKEISAELEKIVADQVPLRPLFQSVWFLDINTSRWKGWPKPGVDNYVPHFINGPDFTLTLQHLKPAE
ncbi:ABC transporter substrate-binding protein [Streptomyces sp. NBC_01020]|uniref:ABC transporter substrate-binding protein n=1 Tax=Streptomyces sp. NBC_01020 TaxID=2903722 RepID=UPI00386D3678|nr:ABC transporter substrate-binding protein [Streptomyces sp. NBC_01020]